MQLPAVVLAQRIEEINLHPAIRGQDGKDVHMEREATESPGLEIPSLKDEAGAGE
jgi:hypothetical protein